MQNVLLISNNIVREGYYIISLFYHTLIQLFSLHSSEKISKTKIFHLVFAFSWACYNLLHAVCLTQTSRLETREIEIKKKDKSNLKPLFIEQLL